MSTSQIKNESKFLESARILLTNAQSHSEIKPALEEFGMGETQVSVGWQIFKNTKTLWETNKTENAETTVASNAYKTLYNELEALFKRHRDFSLYYFKKDPDALVKLGVKGRFPTRYNEFFDKVKQFYTTIQSDAGLQTQMDRIKITSEVVSNCLEKLDTLLAARAEFDKEAGESQDATQSKNAALTELKEWLDDFDAIAKIALYDKPQLLEVLGTFVRN